MIKIASIVMTFFISVSLLIDAGCSDDDDNDTDDAEGCAEEGESVAAVADPPPCCEGLELIPPKTSSVGIMGICTAKCGNGICDTQTESSENCPADCGR